MATIAKTTKKVSLAMVFALLFFSSTFAFANNPSEDSSMYRYNALENNNFFLSSVANAASNVVISTTSLVEVPKNNKLPDDVSTKLQDVTKKQNFSTEQIQNTISSINSRGGLKAFILGNNLGILKFQLVQINDQIYTLNALFLEAQDGSIKIQIDSQIKFLKEEKTMVEDFILKQKSRFSLFGWVNMF